MTQQGKYYFPMNYVEIGENLFSLRNIFSYLTLLQTKKGMSFFKKCLQNITLMNFSFSAENKSQIFQYYFNNIFLSIFSIFTRVLTFFMFHRFTKLLPILFNPNRSPIILDVITTKKSLFFATRF